MIHGSSRISDATRLGMIGFSLGTAVTLMLAGATPDFAHLDAYCDAHPTDVMAPATTRAWRRRPQNYRAMSAGVQIPLPPPLPLQAILSCSSPYGLRCSRFAIILAAVTMPVLQFRPDHSQLGEENSTGLAASLSRRPQFQEMRLSGTHFIFADALCSPSTACKRLLI